MKRTNNFYPTYESTPKTPKLGGKQYTLQRIASTGTSLTTFDGKVLIPTGGNKFITQDIVRSGNPIKIKPGTAIKIEPNQLPFIQSNGTISSGQGQQQTNKLFNNNNNNSTVKRPTIFIKGPTVQKKTIRSVTIELIEKNPYLHLGITEDRLGILQNIICPTINVTRLDLYITLKKLRLNEDFQILAEYFEYTELDIQKIFHRTLIKLSKCMKYLVRWPESKKYYDRHKNLPISFRSKLSFVQSLIECVETDVKQPQYPQTIEQLECKNYKYILTITPSGIISYVSDAYVGNNHDDLTIFNACNFRNIIPKYLSLVADPGKAIRKKAIKTITTTTTDDNDNNSGGGTGSGIVTIKQEKNHINKLKSRITKRTGSTTSITSTSGNNNKKDNNKDDNNEGDDDDDHNIDKIITNSIDSDTDTDSNTDSADEIDEIIDNDGKKIIKSNKKTTTNNKKKNINKTSSLNSTMNIINSELTSLNVKDFSIPTVRVREPACRLQIRNLIYLLREFKILQTYNVLEPQIYQYINEILVICSALTNLQR